MEKIDNHVFAIEKADFNTKFKHDYALRTNLVERILNTLDEKFDFITSDFVSLKIDDNIEINLHKVKDEVVINVYYNDSFFDSFTYKEPFISSCQHKLTEEQEKQNSEREMLLHKIKSICKSGLELTEKSKKYMSANTERFYAIFDAISGYAE